jgi:hypothetical protein
MFRVALRRALLFSAFLGLPFIAQPAGAQSVSLAGETRVELTARARTADSLGRHDEAFRLRSRLRDGDFEVGDQIIVQLDGGALVRNDSLVVQEGKVLRLVEPLGDLSVAGVLRSEISDLIKARVDRLYKNEVLHVTPLLRLSASGALRGFYHFRPDLPLNDAIMKMGGQSQTADISKIEIRRGERMIWANPDVQTALADGLTLAQLELEPGDEINVASAAQKQWLIYLQYGIPVLTGIVLQMFLRRSR